VAGGQLARRRRVEKTNPIYAVVSGQWASEKTNPVRGNGIVYVRHSRKGGNPGVRLGSWIPAFAGMTRENSRDNLKKRTQFVAVGNDQWRAISDGRGK
jgi:hypothetical protein